MNIKNSVYNSDGTIDCEIEHPEFGWIPFTASQNDPEQHGRDIFAAVQNSAAPYVPPPPPSEEEVMAEQAAEIRAKRNGLLSTSDWTQMPDAPVDQAAWATYRQALRDIPQQDGFPTDVVWPTEPV